MQATESKKDLSKTKRRKKKEAPEETKQREEAEKAARLAQDQANEQEQQQSRSSAQKANVLFLQAQEAKKQQAARTHPETADPLLASHVVSYSAVPEVQVRKNPRARLTAQGEPIEEEGTETEEQEDDGNTEEVIVESEPWSRHGRHRWALYDCQCAFMKRPFLLFLPHQWIRVKWGPFSLLSIRASAWLSASAFRRFAESTLLVRASLKLYLCSGYPCVSSLKTANHPRWSISRSVFIHRGCVVLLGSAYQ